MTIVTASPSSLRVYFRPTTVGQRQLLFSAVEETGNVSEAARRAHVSRSTYYYWLPRYESDGETGLATERSRAPHRTRIPPVSTELQAEVLAYHRAHPGEGCRSVANAIRKVHNWQKVIGHNKVREIIIAAQTSSTLPSALPPPPDKAKDQRPKVVHAPRSGQTVNLDLCVVPWTHEGSQALARLA